MDNSHPHPVDEGFMDLEEMKTELTRKLQGLPPIEGRDKTKQQTILEKWINDEPTDLLYGHHEKIGDYNCNTLVDKWWEWAFTTAFGGSQFTNPFQPYALRMPFKMRSSINSKDPAVKDDVWFLVASAFREPDLLRIITDSRNPILIPVYNMAASIQEYPSCKGSSRESTEKNLVDLITSDLVGLDFEKLKVTFDGLNITGCCVIRNKSFEIRNVSSPRFMGILEDRLGRDNSIQICHGGFWLLFKPEKASSSGDHLLYFDAKSINYETSAKVAVHSST